MQRQWCVKTTTIVALRDQRALVVLVLPVYDFYQRVGRLIVSILLRARVMNYFRRRHNCWHMAIIMALSLVRSIVDRIRQSSSKVITGTIAASDPQQ